jgi:hypothetical protein
MLKPTSIIVGLLCILAASGRSTAQQAAAVTAIIPGRAIETFVRTPEGDWQTTIKGADGRERPFVYVPPNKVLPQISAEPTLILGNGTLRVCYRYEVVNGPGAAQELSVLFFRGVRQSEVKEQPSGWTLVAPPSPGNLTFMGPSSGKVIRGFLPGAQAQWTLESDALPGVILVQAKGDAGEVTVPEGLTEKQREEFDALSRDMTVNVPSIGPVVSSGIGEPELTFSVVLARVLSHYAVELRRYRHPFADDAIRLANAVAGKEGAALEEPSTRAALEELAAISKQDVADVWHRQLSAGLSVCAEALLSGFLPLKGMRGGAE